MKRWFWIPDAVVVLSFAIIGADSHGFSYGLSGALRVAAPFLIALAAGIAATRAWRKPLSLVNGAVLGVITLTGGMLLRRHLWDQGTARTFILVSGMWFIGIMVAWRLVAIGIIRFRNRRSRPALDS